MSPFVRGIRNVALGITALAAVSGPALAGAETAQTSCGYAAMRSASGAAPCRVSERPAVRRHVVRHQPFLAERPILVAEASGLYAPFTGILFLGVGY